jgi:hypothetical protein
MGKVIILFETQQSIVSDVAPSTFLAIVGE